jgi:arylamine N-acetyltransferase
MADHTLLLPYRFENDRYGRVIYTPQQLEAFFNRIGLKDKPSPLRDTPISLDFLATLQKCHLAAIPFESLSLHYSQHHIVSIDPQAVFRKIVGEVNLEDGSVKLNAKNGEGRGGYCMENSLLFGTVLRSLGFDVYPTGARVNEAVQPIAASTDWKGPKFDGW